jgi:hypothetical protein
MIPCEKCGKVHENFGLRWNVDRSVLVTVDSFQKEKSEIVFPSWEIGLRRLAATFGICLTQVRNIVSGKCWRESNEFN